MKRCFVVLGMPRTGTSLTMGILSSMGVFTGESRTGKNNPCYYENKLLFAFINRESSVSAGQVISSLERDAPENDIGIKHPQLAYRWYEFKPHVKNPVFVITHRRDIDAQYNSHRQAINRQSRPDFDKRQRDYYQQAAEVVNGSPSYNVFYEDWLKDDSQLKSIAEFFKLEVTDRAKKLADPSLKHF